MSQIDNSAISAVAVGNTISTAPPKKKQVSASIRWCFTLNNYTEDEYSAIVSIIRGNKLRYGIMGKEVGDSGTPHLQGYVEFKTRNRPMSVFDNKRIHWEKAKGDKESNIDYCSKEDLEPFVYDINPKFIQHIEKLYDWELELIEKLKGEPNDREITWIWESEGCQGKTTFQKYLFGKFDDLIVLGGKGSDMLNGIVQYQDKNKKLPKIVLIDIPRSCKDFVSYSGIEKVKDMFFYSGKYEGGMVCGACPHVVCFANEEPEYDKMSMDRWSVKEINNA